MTIELDAEQMAALPKRVAVWFDPQTGKVMEQGVFHRWDKTTVRAHFPVFIVGFVDGKFEQADIYWENGNVISVRDAIPGQVLAYGPGEKEFLPLVDTRSNVFE